MRTRIFIFGLFAVGVAIIGTGSVHAQDSSALSLIQSDVDQLLLLKDNTMLPYSQRVQMEIDLKRSIISKILDASISQLSDAQKQLGSLSFPKSDDWSGVREYFNQSFSDGISYYQNQKKMLSDNGALSINDLNALAKNIESKKASAIDPSLKRLASVTLALNTSTILPLVDDRLTKVTSDIEKIYNQKLVRSQTLHDLLNQASDAVKQAHDDSDAALVAIINLYAADQTTSTQQFSDTLAQQIKDAREQAAIQAASSTPENTTSTPAITIIKITQQDLDNWVAQQVASSYQNIKTAYDIFVKMSANVKKYLQQ